MIRSNISWNFHSVYFSSKKRLKIVGYIPRKDKYITFRTVFESEEDKDEMEELLAEIAADTWREENKIKK